MYTYQYMEITKNLKIYCCMLLSIFLIDFKSVLMATSLLSLKFHEFLSFFETVAKCFPFKTYLAFKLRSILKLITRLPFTITIFSVHVQGFRSAQKQATVKWQKPESIFRAATREATAVAIRLLN